jgi:hypothetical protein
MRKHYGVYVLVCEDCGEVRGKYVKATDQLTVTSVCPNCCCEGFDYLCQSEFEEMTTGGLDYDC